MGPLHRNGKSEYTGMDFKLAVKNFGPVYRGALHLKPLTILVGPNNSGKSYVAMLVHSILSSYEMLTSGSLVYGLGRLNLSAVYKSCDARLQKIIKQNKGAKPFPIPASMTKKIIGDLTADYGKILESTIERNFGADIGELVRKKQKSARVTVAHSHIFGITLGKELSITSNIHEGLEYRIQTHKRNPDIISDEITGPNSVTLNIGRNVARQPSENSLGMNLLDSVTMNIRPRTIPADSYYLPAARSGILHGHRALSASIVRDSAAIKSRQIPMLTGIVSDFMYDIITLPDARGRFFDLACDLEADLLGGSIQLRHGRDNLPEITYGSKHYEIPLHRTSSTISEIAPLSLYLKHVVRPGNLLIIEEPEAHLHPANQRILAKYIVRLIRSGLNVLVTTHSVFLLEQLGKYVLAGRLDAKTRTKKLGYGPDDYLLSEEVSPYVFTRVGDDKHGISKIETNDEDGISQEEFVRVNESLYSESVKLWENLPA